MRIVYYTPPSTPGQYFALAVKASLLAYLGLTLFYFLFSFLGDSENTVFSFFHEFFSPVTSTVFSWAGLTDLTHKEAGLYTLFMLLFTPAMLNVIPMMRLKLEQLRLLDEAYGPVRRPEHIFWFSGAAFFLFGFFSLRYIAPSTADGLTLAFVDGTRVAAVLVCLICCTCFLIIGWRLYGSWCKSPDSIRISAPKKKPKPQLKVAIDNTATVRTGSKPALNLTDSDNGIYVALTAEMIQAAGRTKALPTAETLLVPMEMLQKAALITRSGQFSHADLKGLCERACALLTEGKLTHMPDLKTALALYKRANPAKLMDIAAELKKQLEA